VKCRSPEARFAVADLTPTSTRQGRQTERHKRWKYCHDQLKDQIEVNGPTPSAKLKTVWMSQHALQM